MPTQSRTEYPQKIQVKRGLNTNRTSVTPSSGEMLWTTDTKNLYVGDGTTAGGVFIGGNSSVTGSGTANRVAYWNSTSSLTSNSNLYFDGTNVGIGGITSSFVGLLHIETESIADTLYIDRYGGNPNTVHRRANGTKASPTQVLASQVLSTYGTRPYVSDLTAFSTSNTGDMSFISSENISSTTKGTLFRIRATATGTTTLDEVFRVTGEKNVFIGGGATAGTSAVGVIHLGFGTAPTSSPADTVQLWSADRNAVAGKASLHIRTEDGTSHILGDAVGFGILTPTTVTGYRVVEARGTSEGGLFSVNYNDTVYARFYTNSNSKGYIGTSTNHPFVLQTNLTDRVTIDTSGNVGINTTTPHYSIEANGTIGQTHGSSWRKSLTSTNFGYSASYRVLMLGSASNVYNVDDGAVTLSLGYNPSANTNSSFTGDGSEILCRNITKFITPNVADTSYNLNLLVLNNDRIGLGTSTPGHKLHISYTDPTVFGYAIDYTANDNNSPSMAFRKARGTPSSPQDITGGYVSAVSNYGYHTGNFVFCNSFGTVVDGTPTSTHIPGKFLWEGYDDSGVYSTKFSIRASGNIGFNIDTFGTSAVKVIAIASGTAPTTSPTDAVQVWSADRNATAGKASLHIRTEDGTSHVFGDLSGIGTTTPVDSGFSRNFTVSGGTSGTVNANITIQGNATADGVVAQYDVYNNTSQLAAINIRRDSANNSGTMLFITRNAGVPVEVLRLRYDGRVGILTSTPSNDIGIGGNTARVIAMERHTTANTAGNALLIQSGGATSGATNKTAGDLFLITGRTTGNATPALVKIETAAISATSGTTDNALVDRAIYGPAKVLTNNSAITIVNATLANGTAAAWRIDYAIEVTDGTDFQSEVGSVYINAVNKAGTVTRTITEVNSQQAVSAGTLTTTWAASTANPVAISINANSSLTPSTGYPRVTYSIQNFGQQAVALV